jgi:hypothetical protein
VRITSAFFSLQSDFNIQVPVFSKFNTDCLKNITNDPTFSIEYVPSFINLSKYTKDGLFKMTVFTAQHNVAVEV